ncbi:hypothetical protein [Micromonospora sp. NPDC005203]|uniref:hypothetical protein n=1 Tax=Micromonospora sp. NPDC005203 TaxID=3364226 RepID=UPI0036BB2187
MRYDELEAAILQLVMAAGEDELRAFGLETVTRLVQGDLLDTVWDHELDEDAWEALASARENVRTASAAELRAQLERIDAGIRADGDLDNALLIVITALEHWTTYLEEGRREELYELALRSVEEIDMEVPADLDDFLTAPEMAAEYERIRRLLTAGLTPPFPAAT